MYFISLKFFALVTLLVILYYSIKQIQFRKVLLLFSSLLFYGQFQLYYLITLILVIFITYFSQIILQKTRDKIGLWLGISLNIILLAYFKYNFLFHQDSLMLGYPIGLSFYSFQSISYLVDLNNDKSQKQYTILSLGLYLSFFPKIMAGPIERASTLIPQFDKTQEFNRGDFFIAIKIITYALFCKIILANRLGIVVNEVFENAGQSSGFEILIGSVFYSLEIFFDFFSYSILAIGLGRLFGIQLSENFNNPYFATSLKQFWRRWNITLLLWLRDYVFIPLGGSKVKRFKIIGNILIVFFISGLWHGGSVNFLIWGFGHAVIFITEYLLESNIKLKGINDFFLFRFFRWLTTFSLVSLLWVIFRTEDLSVLTKIFQSLLNYNNWGTLNVINGGVIIPIFFVAVITLILQVYDIFKVYIFSNVIESKKIIWECVLLNGIVLTMLFWGLNQNSSFIYFQF